MSSMKKLMVTAATIGDRSASMRLQGRIAEILSQQSSWLLNTPAAPLKLLHLKGPALRNTPRTKQDAQQGGEQPLKQAAFHVLRDDMLHPTWGGNKARKLDAVVPRLMENQVTDVVSRQTITRPPFLQTVILLSLSCLLSFR